MSVTLFNLMGAASAYTKGKIPENQRGEVASNLDAALGTARTIDEIHAIDRKKVDKFSDTLISIKEEFASDWMMKGVRDRLVEIAAERPLRFEEKFSKRYTIENPELVQIVNDEVTEIEKKVGIDRNTEYRDNGNFVRSHTANTFEDIVAQYGAKRQQEKEQEKSESNMFEINAGNKTLQVDLSPESIQFFLNKHQGM